MTRRVILMAAGVAALLGPIQAQVAPPATNGPAQTPVTEDEQDDGYDSIIVTGSVRVRQGGAQDARHFRKSASIGMPRPESLTAEGLLGEHDLELTSSRRCAQTFCLVGESIGAGLPTRPGDDYFVGLGFTSDIKAETWKREPLNLIAVVDKSGSMDGEPLDLVRRSLTQIVGQLGKGDSISIILYGDESHVYLPPTPIATGRDAALRAIGAIRSAGSTNMEAGLKVGYELAGQTRPEFRGNTRMMLFTDEQPNVGATDAASFMGMADLASRQGIGLTTIGVGVQFDGELATTISSVRGGNLFFIATRDDVKDVFASQLDTLVSELAHDVRITMTPPDGHRISGVFGVPGTLMKDGAHGTVTVTVPTAFFSTNGGGIFVALGKADERRDLPTATLTPGSPILTVDLAYRDARNGRDLADRIAVAPPTAAPSPVLKKARALVDEYLVLSEATTLFHRDNQPKRSFALLNDLGNRLDASAIDGLEGEKKLVDRLRSIAAFYAGYGGEQPRAVKPMIIRGAWVVTSARGMEGVRRGDSYEFEEDQVSFRSKRGDDESEPYEINERQVHLTESKLVFDYRVSADRLELVDEKGLAHIILRRASQPDAS